MPLHRNAFGVCALNTRILSGPEIRRTLVDPELFTMAPKTISSSLVTKSLLRGDLKAAERSYLIVLCKLRPPELLLVC
jgi:hypothetical protein